LYRLEDLTIVRKWQGLKGL